MAGFRPVALFGLTVPPGDEPIPAFKLGEYPATFKLSMAALDPFAKPEKNETTEDVDFKGATLRIIRVQMDDDDDDEDDDDESADMNELADLIGAESDDSDDLDEEDDDDEEVNGGPSDLSKSAKARKIEALKQAIAETKDSMDVDESPKLSTKAKGKAKTADKVEEDEDEEEDEMDDEEDEDDEDDDEFEGPEEFVLCTLDPSKNYQQALDITINEYETVFFQVSGTHAVYLTGNILVPDEGEGYGSDEDSDEEDDEYDLSPDEDELDLDGELGLPGLDDESDDLDDLEDPRVTEVDSADELEVPKLVATKKGKNKRSAPDSADTSMVDDVVPSAASVDDILAKSLKQEGATAPAMNGEQKLSKKQRKKLKGNAGNAVDAPTVPAAKEDVGVKAEAATKASPKPDKKVQFSKTLIQGPTPSPTAPETAKSEATKSETVKKTTDQAKVNGDTSAKASSGSKVVNGVTIEDKKAGSGPAAKKGDKVSMRYIGKLATTKQQFDANKKGKPFSFTLDKGEVIKGWDIGINGMRAGGERRITIPAKLAYGSQNQPGIPSNSDLVFDVKLLDIK